MKLFALTITSDLKTNDIVIKYMIYLDWWDVLYVQSVCNAKS
jgi:hypothetical protein